ncbi:MAG: hypothetical protein NC392_02680 [Roseburia sp.]|nr:hypothetical protein [Roseburia sp.]
MANYDGSVRINTEINTSDVPSQLQKLENSMQKAADKVVSLRQKMNALKNVEIPTDEYKEIQNQIEITEKKINDLIARQERFFATSGKESSSAFKKMQYDLDELNNSLPYLQGELQDLVDTGKTFTLGSDSEEYAKLGQELQYAESNLSALNKRHEELAVKQGTVSERFSKMRDSASKAFNAINNHVLKSGNIFSILKNSASKAFSLVSSGAKQSGGICTYSTGGYSLAESAYFHDYDRYVVFIAVYRRAYRKRHLFKGKESTGFLRRVFGQYG